MEQPILNTKIEIPPLGGDIITRERLIRQINENSDQKVLLISAAAGFGKTTLLSQWAKQKLKPVAWFSIDENDNDVSCFFNYIIRALQKWKPAIGKTALNLLQVPQPPQVESILIILLNEIHQQHDKVTLILDDFHLISSARINQLMNFLIDHLPPMMQIIMSSRSDPNLPLARWISQNRLVEIRAAELSFTSEESDVLFNKTLGLGLTSEDIERLKSRTEGWVTGLQLAALSLKGYADRNGFIKQFHGDNRYIVDYLIEEVLHHQPEEVQTFLLQTAILNRLNGSLCDMVTDRQNSVGLLEQLEKQNMFMFPMDEGREWYRYHQLFKDVLIHRLQHNSDIEDKLNELNQKAGEWYANHGFNDEAIDHFLNAKNYLRAAELLEITAEVKWLCGQQIKLLRWFKRFPQAYIIANPLLGTFFARELFMHGHGDEAEQILNQAEKNLVTFKNKQIVTCTGLKLTSEELRGRILVVRAVTSSYRGNFTGVILYAGEALELLHEKDLRWRNIAEITYALANSWAGFGNLTLAKKAFIEAQQSSEKIGDIYLYIFCGICIAASEVLQGESKKAVKTYSELLFKAEKLGMTNSGIVGAIYTALGSLYCELNEVKNGEKFLEKGLQLAKQGHDILMLASAQLNQLRFLFYTNSIQRALKLVDEMSASPQASLYPPWMKHVLSALSPWLWIKSGKLKQAIDWAKELGFPKQDEISMRHETEYVVLVRILIVQNEFDKAEQLIEYLMIDAQKGARFLTITELHVLKAIARYGQEDIKSAVKELSTALSFGESRGLFMFFVYEGELIAELIEVILDEIMENKTSLYPNISETYLKNLLMVIRTKRVKSYENKLEEPLSEREQEVMIYIAEGLTNNQIAEKLFISLNTVRTHTKKIYSKLGVHSRTQAIAKAKDIGLIN
jgi:LuxR family maltose regulon positive regulatory protein